MLQTGAGNVSIPMIASVGTPTQALATAPLNFSNRAVGSTAVGSITLSNPGPAPASVQAINVQNAPSSITRTGGTCATSYPFAIASGGSCTVQMSFAPVVVGAQSATLQVVADTGNITVAVSGTGIVAAPLPTFAPAQLNFGFSQANSPVAVTHTVTIANPGSAPLGLLGLTGAVLGIGILDSYRIVGGSCVSAVPIGYALNTTLAANASCTLAVRFLYQSPPPPVQSLNLDSALVLQTGAGNVSIPMIASVGTFIYPLIVSPPVVTFSASATSAEQRLITLTNPAPVSASVFTMNFPAGYGRTGGTCLSVPFALIPSANCTIVIEKTPTVAAKASAQLKALTFNDVPILVTTGNTNVRLQIASQPLVSVSIETQPTGLRVAVNGQLRVAPVTLLMESGSSLTVEARSQNLGGNGYSFGSWSDGGAASHSVLAESAMQAVSVVFNGGALVAKLDVDNDGIVNAATDGILIMRYLLGVRGAALLAGVPIPDNAERQDAAAITGYLDAIQAELNVDGVGGSLATTDAVIILRSMLGVTGAGLATGLQAPAALTPEQIQSKIDAMKP